MLKKWLQHNDILAPYLGAPCLIFILLNGNVVIQKLKDFIHMQLPSGFPVKIEIPLFHVINARITFSNIQVIKFCFFLKLVIAGKMINKYFKNIFFENF